MDKLSSFRAFWRLLDKKRGEGKHGTDTVFDFGCGETGGGGIPCPPLLGVGIGYTN